MSLKWMNTGCDVSTSTAGPWGLRLAELGLSRGLAAVKLLSTNAPNVSENSSSDDQASSADVSQEP